MKLWDYHNHNERCKHAVGQVEEYVQNAISQGLVEIGLSDHFPMYLLPEKANVWHYSMSKEEFPNYLNDLKNLKEKYASQIKIKFASEVDYYQPAFEEYKKSLSPFLPDLDYIIGSIHVIQFQEGDPIAVDDDIGKEYCLRYTANRVYGAYYDSMLELVSSGYFDIVGHLDLPKKFGIMPEDPDFIWEKVLKILDAAEKTGIAIEINTSGFYKPAHEQYPSERIINELVSRNIPITLGSDAHEPSKIAYRFSEIASLLKKKGRSTLTQITKREKQQVPFD